MEGRKSERERDRHLLAISFSPSFFSLYRRMLEQVNLCRVGWLVGWLDGLVSSRADVFIFLAKGYPYIDVVITRISSLNDWIFNARICLPPPPPSPSSYRIIARVNKSRASTYHYSSFHRETIDISSSLRVIDREREREERIDCLDEIILSEEYTGSRILKSKFPNESKKSKGKISR